MVRTAGPTYRFTIAIIESSFYETGKTEGDIVRICRESGFAGVEGWLPLLEGKSMRDLEALLKHGEQYGFRLAVENMLPASGGRLGCDIDHLEKIRARHDHPHLGFCLDTGHALVSSGERAMEVFHCMKDRLIAFHLDDNAGDRDSHLAPGHGRFFWRELFDELAGMTFTNTLCVEAPPFAYGPDYSVEAWKRMHEEVSALAAGRSAGD